ncbi:MAG TPA: hypothetical protein VN673_12880 [Clostridia bacterium]|nr:hypothetical protein [Clostridia bacterium]
MTFTKARSFSRLLVFALCGWLAAAGWLATPGSAQAFTLLGPWEDWMTPELSYRLPGDIGGPVNIHEGYRWNIPTISYGFERSFLDYFGSNGVAAVEAAIAILNALPPASAIDPDSYPLNIIKLNYEAEKQSLADLKSYALSLLLEHMGLADPLRYIYTLRDITPVGPNLFFHTVQRNFDPNTGQPSAYINDDWITYLIMAYEDGTGNTRHHTVNYPVDNVSENYDSIAALRYSAGSYATSLSKDDVGGLRFLLSASRVRWESLLPDVHSASGSQGPLVRGAIRPGVEKLSFVAHPTGAVGGEFLPLTNRWTDVYFENGVKYQPVERITTRPDITFSARDFEFAYYQRTGTTNWANHADMNGNWGGAGPGVIQPPVNITFSSRGSVFLNVDHPLSEIGAYKEGWLASFQSVNDPIIRYPAVQPPSRPTEVSLELLVDGAARTFQWLLFAPAYGKFQLQTSTNLADWTTIGSVTNTGAKVSTRYTGSANELQRFFRIRSE